MISLEDNVGDIIGKAQRGLGVSDSELEKKAGVDLQTIRKLREGEGEGDVDEQALLRVAPVLGLAPGPLCELAKGEWRPERIDQRDGFAQFNTRYHDMTVNAYLVWDPASCVAARLRYRSRLQRNGAICQPPQIERATDSSYPCPSGSCRGLAASARGNRCGCFCPCPRTCLRRERPSTKESISASEIWKLIRA